MKMLVGQNPIPEQFLYCEVAGLLEAPKPQKI